MRVILALAVALLCGCATEDPAPLTVVAEPFVPVAAGVELQREAPPHPLCVCPDYECQQDWICTETGGGAACLHVDCGGVIHDICSGTCE